MVKNPAKTIIPGAISVLIIAILLPLAINTFYQNPIALTEKTSLNNTDKTIVLLNGTESGLWNGSILESTFTNYTNFQFNTTLTHSVNWSITFEIICNNASAVNVSIAQIIINTNPPIDFNDTLANGGLNETFEFNVCYCVEDIPADVVETFSLRFWATIDSNVTISSDTVLTEIYTNDTTDQLNVIYFVIPIIAVISIIMGMIVKKNN